MNEETIMDQKSQQEKDNRKTSGESYRQMSTNEAKSSKKFSMAGVAGIAAGAAVVGGAAMGMTTPIAYDLLMDKQSENDEMNPDSSEELLGYDLSVAKSIDDDMSYEEAFAMAREEVGPDGIFLWNGHVYGTHTLDELQEMSPEVGRQYMANVHHTITNDPVISVNVNVGDQIQGNEAGNPTEENITEPVISENQDKPEDPEVVIDPVEPTNPENLSDLNIENNPNVNVNVNVGDQLQGNGGVNSEGDPDPVAVVEPEPVEEPVDQENPVVTDDPVETITINTGDDGELALSPDQILEEYDTNGDGIIDTAIVDVNGNDLPDVIMDTTGDGNFDTLVVDPTDAETATGVEEINGVCLNEESDVIPVVDEPVVDEPGMEEPVDVPEIYYGPDLNAEDTDPNENLDVDPIASDFTDPNIPIDNNMDMGEFV